jgi:hypothetical protein
MMTSMHRNTRRMNSRQPYLNGSTAGQTPTRTDRFQGRLLQVDFLQRSVICVDEIIAKSRHCVAFSCERLHAPACACTHADRCNVQAGADRCDAKKELDTGLRRYDGFVLVYTSGRVICVICGSFLSGSRTRCVSLYTPFTVALRHLRDDCEHHLLEQRFVILAGGDSGLHLPEQRFIIPAWVTTSLICLNNARHTGAGRYPVDPICMAQPCHNVARHYAACRQWLHWIYATGG